MIFFAVMAAFVSRRLPDPGSAQQRRRARPALQNPYMVVHPPILYMGYVTLSVPFAFAMAALIAGRTDARWLASVRRWTLFAWMAWASAC